MARCTAPSGNRLYVSFEHSLINPPRLSGASSDYAGVKHQRGTMR
jgi:hypothetical protein